MVNWIVVNPDCKGWQNLQSLLSLLQLVMKLFTVGDETYIGTHRTAPVSFFTDCKSYATDCKSDDSACKFCQPLQSVTIARTAIWLTITRGGRLKSDPVHSRGWLKTAISDFVRPGGAYWVGGDWNHFTGVPLSRINKNLRSLDAKISILT